MSWTARQKSFIEQFRNSWIRSNRPTGVTGSRRDFSDFSTWTLAEREAYNKALAQFIAGNPQIYEEDKQAAARYIQSSPIAQIDRASLGDMVEVFFTEAGKQATRINPFSSVNQNLLWIIGGVAVVTFTAVVAYKLTPQIRT